MNIVDIHDVDTKILYSDCTIDTLDFTEWKLLSILKRIKEDDVSKIVDALHILEHCKVVSLSPESITATLSSGEVIPINYLGCGEKIILLSECAAIYKFPIYLSRVYKSMTDKSLVLYLSRYKDCDNITLITRDIFDINLIDVCLKGVTVDG